MSHTNDRRALVFQAHTILVSDAGQTPSAEDISAIDAYVAPVFYALAARGVATIDDFGTPGPTGGEIPTALFLPAARALANAAAPEFGGQTDFDLQARIEKEMIEILSSEPTYAPATAEYF